VFSVLLHNALSHIQLLFFHRAWKSSTIPSNKMMMMQRILLRTQRRAAVASSAASRSSSSSHALLFCTTRCFSAAVEEDITNDDDNRFSIRGTFREGRASYLDMSATTPMDPRVLDKMMPFMVSIAKIFIIIIICDVYILCTLKFRSSINEYNVFSPHIMMIISFLFYSFFDQ
jgi:hypothetical protein